MHLLEQYFLLYERLSDGGRIHTPAEISLEQVADVLFCTERNAKLVLRKLSEHELILWEPGRGRGNRSKLSFLADKENLLFEEAVRLSEEGDYKRAFDMLHSYGDGTSANRRFMEWLDDSFGYRKDMEEELDILRVPSFHSILTLDPADSFYSNTAHMVRQLFDTLVHYDHELDRIVSGIAHDWVSNETATIWTFHLRKGILFHNGAELTSADVEYTLERLRSGKRNSWLLRSLSHVERLSKRAVRIHLTKPNHLFLRYLCTAAMSILPSELAGQSEEQFWRRPIGTGPFMIHEWTEVRFIMHANTSYYQGRPHLDCVDILFIPESNSIHSSLQDVDWKQLLCDKELRDITPENGWQQIEASGSHLKLLSWNLKKDGPQQSIAFRKAVDRIADREAMLRELGGYRDYPAKGFFTRDDSKLGVGLDNSNDEVVRELLQQAGYSGEEVHLYTYSTHAEDTKWLQARCRAYGIEVIVHVIPFAAVPSVFHEADGILHALVFPEAEVCLIENYEQTGSFVKEFLNPRLTSFVIDTIDRALACRESEQRAAILAEIEDRLREESQLLFLFGLKFQSFIHPSFKGAGFNSLGLIDFKHIWRQRCTKNK